MTKQKKFAMYQDAVRKPVGEWAEKRLVKLTGKSAERHNSENESGFGRDLRNWLDKGTVLPGNTLSVALVGKNMGHPAVYPVGLPEFFIKLFTKENDRVLDPFGGSGSTAIAAERLKRNVVLIDVKKEYVDVAKERINRLRPVDRQRFFYSSVEAAPEEWVVVATLLDEEQDVE